MPSNSLPRGGGVKTGRGDRYKLHLLMWGNGSPSICFSSSFRGVTGIDFARGFGHKHFLHHELQSAPQGGCNRENRKEYFLCQLVVMDNTARTAAGCRRFSRQPGPKTREYKVKPDLSHSHICISDVPSGTPHWPWRETYVAYSRSSSFISYRLSMCQAQPLYYFHINLLFLFCEAINI